MRIDGLERPDLSALDADLAVVEAAFQGARTPSLRDVAAALTGRNHSARGGFRIALVASSVEDMLAKLRKARSSIRSGTTRLSDPSGLWLSTVAEERPDPIAFLFPGQGSQAPDMLGELALYFPEVREGFDAFDEALRDAAEPPIGPSIFAPLAFDDEGRKARRQSLRSTEIAQKALGAASLASLRLIRAFGLTPSAVAGHSFGELAALHAAGYLSESSFAALSVARGRLMAEAVQNDEPGGMAALVCGPDRVEPWLSGIERVSIVNLNGPLQTVISGPRKDLDEVLNRARSAGVRGVPLGVSGAFHTSSLASVCQPLAELVGRHISGPCRASVYSNVSASPYPADARRMASQVAEQVIRPVRFSQMIEAMYTDGLRTFLEVGPGSTLTSLVGSILGDRPHRSLAIEPTGKPGLLGWLSTLGALFVAGHDPTLERLFAGRAVRS